MKRLGERGIIGEALLLVVALGFVAYVFMRVYAIRRAAAVKDFAACARAGYPIQQSFPRVCHTPDGRSLRE